MVYTKEAETADQYIEKVVHQIGKKYHVTVVTSDGVEQVVTAGQGGTLISSREFKEEVELVRRQIRKEYESRRETGKNYLFDHMDEKMAEEMEVENVSKICCIFENNAIILIDNLMCICRWRDRYGRYL